MKPHVVKQMAAAGGGGVFFNTEDGWKVVQMLGGHATIEEARRAMTADVFTRLAGTEAFLVARQLVRNPLNTKLKRSLERHFTAVYPDAPTDPNDVAAARAYDEARGRIWQPYNQNGDFDGTKGAKLLESASRLHARAADLYVPAPAAGLSLKTLHCRRRRGRRLAGVPL